MGFHVDARLCRRCGLCAAGCVCGLIEYGEDGYPCIRKERAPACVHCGHCIAVCPSGAIKGSLSSPVFHSALPVCDPQGSAQLSARARCQGTSGKTVRACRLCSYCPQCSRGGLPCLERQAKCGKALAGNSTPHGGALHVPEPHTQRAQWA